MMTATLNDLRVLATALPPSERVFGGEAADILSALVAVAQHGKGILDAVKEGNIADFYHDAITTDAEARGVEAPQRGATTPAPAPTAPPVGQSIDYEKLATLVAQKLSGVTHEPTPAPPADAPPTDKSVTHEPDPGILG